MTKLYISFIIGVLLTLGSFAQTNFILFGSTWKYLDNGSNQGTAWKSISFNDGTWKTGPGKFGYGITGAATVVSYGKSAGNKYITTYFRKIISIADPNAYTSYTASVKRDDGIAVYVNGLEVYRNNLPTGTLSYTTTGSSASDNGNTVQTFNINNSAFVSGINVIAVEIHQDKGNTPDMAFDLAMVGKDQIAPSVVSINRQSPTTTTTTATSVTYRVTFSEKVSGVNTTDFAISRVSGTVTGTVASVVAVGTTGNIYDITVSSITGTGDLRLDLHSTSTGIVDGSGNAISGGYTSGQIYTIQSADTTAPSVVSINRQSPTTITTTATSVTYRVTFSEKVSGVSTTDFAVTRVSGTVTGTIASVVAVGTTGDIYDVAVSSITGTGDLRLDLHSTSTGITDASGNAISGGYNTGQSYTIQSADTTAPSVVSINRQSPTTITTTATSVTYRVTFSEKVSGVSTTDFAVTRVSGTVTGTVASVVAVGTTGDIYDVAVSSITGTGDLRLDLHSTSTGITDASGNAIGGGYFSGQIYTIQTSNLPPNAPTNPSPAIGAYSSPTSTTLCATVSDPNNGQLRVRYYGRKKPTSGKFTLIMIPDTQYYTSLQFGGTNSMFKAQTNWIAKNRALKNIVYVGHLGDCVDHGDQYEEEWKRADTAMKTIENPTLTGLTQGMPYGVCVGNHDQSPNGSATGTTTFYNKYFSSSRFSGRSYYGGHRGTNNDNHYQLFSAGGLDFLVICPEYDQSTSFSAAGGVLDWMESLIKSYPTRKVIVMSHLVVNGDFTFSTQGQAIYNRLKIYPNLILMFGGHIAANTGEVRRSETYNGNTVHSVVSDYQSRTDGGQGLLRIYEFDPSINNVSVKTYSPYTNTYETDASSQFSLAVNLNSPAVPFALTGELSNVTSGANACVSWPSLQTNADYEWYAEVFDGQSTTKGPTWSFTTKAPTTSTKGTSSPVARADILGSK